MIYIKRKSDNLFLSSLEEGNFGIKEEAFSFPSTLSAEIYLGNLPIESAGLYDIVEEITPHHSEGV
jgi:hypothetical protein